MAIQIALGMVRDQKVWNHDSRLVRPQAMVGSGAKSRSGFPPCEYDEHLCTRHHNNE